MERPDKKGIILAGGAGTRLDPLTRIACKQLLPIYDKPMVYYPLSTLMLGDVRDILLISTPKDLPCFKELFGDGSHLGMSISYAEQAEPNGIAQAFLIAEDFLDGQGATLILGDNVFYGELDFFHAALALQTGGCIFGFHVRDPERFGVVEFDKNGKALGIEEKPSNPKSSYAVPGLYVYDNTVVTRTKNLKPSARGELEITDLNLSYLNDGQLEVKLLGSGVSWLDTGTPESLLEAGNYIQTIEKQQNRKIGCIETIAYHRGFIDTAGMNRVIDNTRNPDYREYLENELRRLTASS